MGEKWDKFTSKQFQDFSYSWGVEALRVLKPGGYCLAFSGTRTYHRMVCGLEDAGFNIKDTIMWCYGSGFPKSYDISKGIDKYYGKERKKDIQPTKKGNKEDWESNSYKTGGFHNYSQAISLEAQQWDGWGTALKPSVELIVLAQKPYENTYAENVLKYGVGGLNIDKCRIDYKNKDDFDKTKIGFKGIKFNGDVYNKSTTQTIQILDKNKGRFPSNLLLDEVSAEMMDMQSGNIPTSARPNLIGNHYKNSKWFDIPHGGMFKAELQHNDHGGASRFFYCGKAHKSERNAGLLTIPEEFTTDNNKWTENDYRQGNGEKTIKPKKNNISTLKPINIMRYLVRLITPPNGTVLDPFAGSGTTGIACIIEGFNYILIEKRKRFANTIIPLRLKHWSDPKNWLILKNHNALPKVKDLKKQKQNNSIIQYINGVKT